MQIVVALGKIILAMIPSQETTLMMSCHQVFNLTFLLTGGVGFNTRRYLLKFEFEPY